MNKRKFANFFAIITVTLSLLMMGCPTEDSGSSSPTVLTSANSVLGSISGKIVSTINDGTILLEGVTVYIAIPDSNSPLETTTNAGGLYEFENLVPGDYVLTYQLEGYEETSTRLFVTSDQYKSDDPLNEQAIYTETINSLKVTAGTYTTILSSDGTAADTGVSSVLSADYISSLSLIQPLTGGYYFSIAMVDVELAPLNASISGHIKVNFFTADNNVDSGSSAVAAGVSFIMYHGDTSLAETFVATATRGTFLGSESTVDLSNYLYTGVSDENGDFLIENLPSGKTFQMYLVSFEQVSGDVTYYFDGETAFANVDDVLLENKYIYTLPNVVQSIGTIVIEPVADDAIIIAHNIGDVNINTPLTIDPALTTSAISITFSKSMDPDSLQAGILAGGIELVGTWNSDNTTVTLLPLDNLGISDDEHLVYNLVSTLVLVVSSADGFGLNYSNDLNVYTIDGLDTNHYKYTTAAGVIIKEDATTSELPLDGKLVIDFNKDLAVASLQEVVLTYGASVELDIPAASITVASNVLTIDFSNVELEAGTVYTINNVAISTDYDDTYTMSTYTFTPTNTIKLLSTNIYTGGENIYYEEGAVNIATDNFSITSALTFTFSSTLPTGTEAALYKASEILPFNNITEINKHDMVLLGSATVTTSGAVLTITPTSDLEPGEKYSVAIKIVDNNGFDILNSGVSQFNIDYSSIVASAAGDAKSTPYIQFTTEAALAPLAYNNTVDNHSATNVDNALATGTEFNGSDDIIIEFNKTIGTINSAELYLWDDANANDTLDAGEINDIATSLTTVATSSGSVLTLNPNYQLYPAQKFVLALDLVGSNSSDTYLNEDSDLTTYLKFVVDTVLPADLLTAGGSPITGIQITSIVHATNYKGYDSEDTTLDTLKWDSLEDFPGTGVYTVYSKSGTNNWAASGTTVTEYSALETILKSTLSTGTVAIPHSNNATMATRDAFDGDVTSDFIVTTMTNEGFYAHSTVVSIQDTIPPTYTFTDVNSLSGLGTYTAPAGGFTFVVNIIATEPILFSSGDIVLTLSSPGASYNVVYNDANFNDVNIEIILEEGDTLTTSDTIVIDFTDTSDNDAATDLTDTVSDPISLTI